MVFSDGHTSGSRKYDELQDEVETTGQGGEKERRQMTEIIKAIARGKKDSRVQTAGLSDLLAGWLAGWLTD